ncbi:MAG TPA: hypothetical protein VNJ53_13785 [Gaiellaceae bacterium]|nr:hypothetical protein [Gaiellaceae bacterium]
MTRAYDEERLGELLRLLAPAPDGWVRAAQELPFVRARLDEIVAHAEADRAYRERLVADLERTLALEGLEPPAALVDELRARFGER